MQTKTLAAALTAALAPASSAHEFWLRPNTFTPEPNQVISLQTFNGERFAGDALPRNNAHIARFELLAPDGTAGRVFGRHGAPNSLARPATPGTHRAIYESVENPLVLEPAPFEAYLQEEGLAHIIERRAELGESDQPGREVYVRCAKALVSAGGGPPADLPTGLPLEIVLTEIEDGRVRADVLFQDEPIAGLRVVAVSEGRPESMTELRSDRDGAVSFTPDSGGVWMLTTIHMTRLEDRDDADWKSYWASTTFRLP